MEQPVSNMTNEEVIRRYYSGWEKREWDAIDSVLADGFTFTSPNNDDHINKRTFKEKCWSQTDWINRFELESLIGNDDHSFVKYICHTKNGKWVRNTEYFRFRDGKIEAIEVIWVGNSGFRLQRAVGRAHGIDPCPQMMFGLLRLGLLLKNRVTG